MFNINKQTFFLQTNNESVNIRTALIPVHMYYVFFLFFCFPESMFTACIPIHCVVYHNVLQTKPKKTDKYFLPNAFCQIKCRTKVNLHYFFIFLHSYNVPVNIEAVCAICFFPFVIHCQMKLIFQAFSLTYNSDQNTIKPKPDQKQNVKEFFMSFIALIGVILKVESRCVEKHRFSYIHRFIVHELLVDWRFPLVVLVKC